jgi:hypothetical protein
VTLRHGFTSAGEPSTASYGVFHFGPNNLIDDGKTELLNTGNDRNAITEQPVLINSRGIRMATSNAAKTLFSAV